MLTTLCLLSTALVTAQPALPTVAEGPRLAREPAGWILSPQLARSQEVVYRGSFAEQAQGGNVEYNRAYRFENRILVLESTPQASELAVLTLFKDEAATPERESTTPRKRNEFVRSARLERVRIDSVGRVTAPAGVSLSVALEGPPTLDMSFVPQVPPGRITQGQSWVLREASRPDWRWQCLGAEVVSGVTCVKLQGEQRSEDWDRPRGDRTAWRRQDTLWISPRTGLAQRCERHIQRRLPARLEATQNSVFRAELESSMQYPAQLIDDRRRDVEQAMQFSQTARPWLPRPSEYQRELTGVLARIDAHLDRYPPTPYREALLKVRAQVEAGRRGEVPPELPGEQPQPPVEAPGARELAVGKLAPDFVAPDLTAVDRSASLREWQGRPVLMVFYNPESRSVGELMRLIHALSAQHRDLITVGLAMHEDSKQTLKQWREQGWKFRLLNGTGLRISYAVECTPKMVLLDAQGVVQGIYVGWGSETASEIAEALPQCCGKKVAPPK